MGSVKDVKVLVPPSPREEGEGIFLFSDCYSVFDWGKMPDRIAQKGASLCAMSAFFFEELERAGIKHHCLGVVEEGEVRKISRIKEPPRKMKVKLVQVIPPSFSQGKYDYSVYRELKKNFLLPFEIIFRNVLVEGSSAFKRLQRGELKPEDLGLDAVPEKETILPSPFVELTTKLEAKDRFLSWEEAREISPFFDEEELKLLALKVNEILRKKGEEAGFVLQDGKIECALDSQGELMVVDTVGTLDECRFAFQGIPVSKEVVRNYYRKTAWYQEIEKAPKEAKNWQQGLPAPPLLPSPFLHDVSLLYQAAANALTGQIVFPGIPPLDQVVSKIKEGFSSSR